MRNWTRRSIELVAPLANVLAISLAVSGCATSHERTTLSELQRVRRTIDEEATLVGATLEDYVGYARQASPELRAVFERWRAAALAISRARRLPNPTITYSYFARSVETRVGPQQHRLSVRQSFPWPTSLSAGADAASLRARAFQRRFDALALALEARVADQFWSLWAIDQVRHVRIEQSGIYEQLTEMIRGRLESGAATLAELQQVELAKARLLDSVDQLDDEQVARSATLVGVIGAPFGTPTPVAGDGPALGLAIEGVDVLRASLEAHPAIQVFAEEASASEAQARSLRASRLPGFTVGFDWIQTGEAVGPNTPGDGTDPVVLSLGLSVPLWQGSYRDDVRSAEAQARAFRADSEASLNDRVAQVATHLAMLRNALREHRLHRDTLRPQAQALHESVIAAYSVGRASIADLLMAERDLLEIREREIQAAAVHAREWAWVEALVGRPVEREQGER